MPAVRLPFLRMHCGKRQSTQAVGKLPYAQRPDNPTVRLFHESGDIHECLKTEKQDSEKSGRQPGQRSTCWLSNFHLWTGTSGASDYADRFDCGCQCLPAT